MILSKDRVIRYVKEIKISKDYGNSPADGEIQSLWRFKKTLSEAVRAERDAIEKFFGP
jgi:hypothetical protein